MFKLRSFMHKISLFQIWELLQSSESWHGGTKVWKIVKNFKKNVPQLQIAKDLQISSTSTEIFLCV